MSNAVFENLTSAELQTRYDELLKSGVTVRPDPLPSFLHISGFPHYEEVVSNWYAFFFDTANPHGLGTLFIDSLIDLINESNEAAYFPPFERCSVIRERTVNGKSIDLLLFDDATSFGGEQTYRNAIIIENKVFAALYNDLDFYIDNIKVDENKAGVVLSINVHGDLPAAYSCITHARLVERISLNFGRYLFRAHEKYVLLLKDFLQHISLFRNTDNMKEYVTFYFQHAEKINELNQIRSKAMDALVDELGATLEGKSFQRRRRYPESVNLRCVLHPNILMVLYTAKVFDQATYIMELWFTYGLAKTYKTGAGMSGQAWQHIPVPDGFEYNRDKTGDKYALVGKQTKTFGRTIEDIQQLPLFITNDLEQQWVPFLSKMLQVMNVSPQTVFDTTDNDGGILP